MEDARQDPEEQPRRPRVVDKRVSARPGAAERTPREAPARTPPESQSEAARAPAGAAPPGAPEDAHTDTHLWTPEQEAEMRRIAQEVRDTPSAEWILNAAVTFANVAATKLDAGMSSDAQLAIDALAGLVDSVGPRLGDADASLRQMLAQLQLAYAEAAPNRPPAP